MVAIKNLSFAALAVGAIAGPIASAETSKPFKIGITFQGKDTLYLTSTSVASSNMADGIECTITKTKPGEKASGTLSCGPEKKAFTYSEYHTMKPLEPVVPDKKNVDWSIGADDVLFWGAMPAGTKSVTFSRQKKGNVKSVFAEVCSTFDHHNNLPTYREFWERGVAKAYFV